MKFFKNPVVAVLLALVIILGSTLVNVHFKFGPLCRDITEELYEDDGIVRQLQEIRSDAAVLATLAERNGISPAGISSAAEEMQSSLGRSAGAGMLFRNYGALIEEITAVRQALLHADLSEADAETVNDSLTRIDAAREAISASSYNKDVRAFLAKYDHFPTSILAKLSNVDMPEVFS